jgi:exosortase
MSVTRSRRRMLFGIYSACVIFGSISVVRGLVSFSLHNDTASHHVLIPFVTLALLYQNRSRIFSSIEFAPVVGLAVTLLGLGLLMTGATHSELDQAGSLSVAVGGLVVLWIGGFLLFYGRKAARAALFPLMFLGFMVPIPPEVLDRATLFLKLGSAQTVAAMFTMTGTPYHREGFVFALPKVTIEIADECSGIRSSIALLLTGLLAADMFLRTWWKKALLVALIVPMALVKNSIRIVSLSLLASHVDPRFLTGQLHHEGGIVFFVLTLALLAPPFVLIRNSETALR